MAERLWQAYGYDDDSTIVGSSSLDFEMSQHQPKYLASFAEALISISSLSVRRRYWKYLPQMSPNHFHELADPGRLYFADEKWADAKENLPASVCSSIWVKSDTDLLVDLNMSLGQCGTFLGNGELALRWP